MIGVVSGVVSCKSGTAKALFFQFLNASALTAVRFFTMACLSLFFLPLSIVALPIYKILVYVLGMCCNFKLGEYVTGDATAIDTTPTLYVLVSRARRN